MHKANLFAAPFMLLAVLAGGLVSTPATAQVYMNDANTRTPPRDPSVPNITDNFPRILAHEFIGNASAAEYAKYQFIDAKGINFPRIEAIQSSLSPQTKMLRHISGRAYQSYAYKPCVISGGVAFETTTSFSQGGPASEGCGIYAGHWLYRAGATLTGAINASSNTLRVSDPSRFRSGQYLVIYDKPAGSFRNAEHARINSVNNGAKTITVSRGYKSQAKAHGAGSIVAQHVLGQGSDARLWAFNLTSKSPRDSKGKTFMQFYAEWLGRNLSRYKTGQRTTANVAGVMFDADFYFDLKANAADADNNLVTDNGVSPSGENWQGKGLEEFYQRTRANLPGKYVITGVHDARGFKSAHGVQIESWMDYGNPDFDPVPEYPKFNELFYHYLSGISEHSRGPGIVHNLTKTPTRLYPGRSGGRAKNNAPTRLALGVTLMEDGYFGTHSMITKDAWWDEYAVYTNRGSSNFGRAVPKSNLADIRQNRGWLGQPVGKFKRIYNTANFQPNKSLLNNGTFDGGISGWKGQNVSLSRSSTAKDGSGSLRASAMQSFKTDLGGASVRSPAVRYNARQPYTVAFSLRSEKHREVRVSFGNDRARLPVSPTWRRYVITLTPTSGSQSVLSFGVGKERSALWIDSVYMFRGDANVFQREFRNGLALANGTATAKTINVGSGYRRIAGIQDRGVNNGQVVQQVTLPPYDGLLLLKTDASPPPEPPPPGGGGGGSGAGKIGDYVWRDSDGDGIQDRSESGWGGVTVSLRRCNGPVVRTMKTNGAGRYQFTGVAPGRYQIAVALPGGARFSRAGAGRNNGLSSDIQPNGRSWCTTITGAGENRRSLDAGLIPGGGSGGGSGGGAGGGSTRIGDTVWRDNNRDGIRRNSEPGLAGVQVQLQRCNGSNVATMRTNSAGKYEFRNLKAGSYRIKFTKPSGMRFSPQRRGSDKSRDSNANPSSGLSHCMNLGNKDVRGNIDAGLS